MKNSSEQEKISSISYLTNKLESLKKEGKKIVHCHGVFDLVHPGHIHHLQSAKKKGDILVVSLTKDIYVNKGPGRPIFNENLRAQTIAAIEAVDYVCLVDDYNAVDCIKQLKPDIYIKGAEYSELSKDITGMIFEEKKAIESIGGIADFTDKEITFSSTNLINRFLGGLNEEQQIYLENIKQKYGSSNQIIEKIKQLENQKILLVGDTIIDQYVYCEPIGQSLKNPLVVNKFLSEETFCGGVVAVANQLAEFCNEVHLVTLLGNQNSYSDYILSKLKPNVTIKFFEWPGKPTVVKKRYLYQNADQKIFEICFIENKEQVNGHLEQEILNHIQKEKVSDLTMITDYGHGLLTPKIIEELKNTSKFLAVNAQTNSANLGFNYITKKYNKINFATIDEGEAKLALHEQYMPMETGGKRLLELLESEQVIITLGKKGSVGFNKTQEVYKTPSFASSVVDRVGAGDAFYAITAPCASLNIPLDLTSFIGNATSALAVQIVGNREPVKKINLYKLIQTLLK